MTVLQKAARQGSPSGASPLGYKRKRAASSCTGSGPGPRESVPFRSFHNSGRGAARGFGLAGREEPTWPPQTISGH
jgi:hypothetical protein